MHRAASTEEQSKRKIRIEISGYVYAGIDGGLSLFRGVDSAVFTALASIPEAHMRARLGLYA